jgi:hypothetical protein
MKDRCDGVQLDDISFGKRLWYAEEVNEYKHLIIEADVCGTSIKCGRRDIFTYVVNISTHDTIGTAEIIGRLACDEGLSHR